MEDLKDAYAQLTAEQRKTERSALTKSISEGEAAIAQAKKALAEQRSMWSEDMFDKAGVDRTGYEKELEVLNKITQSAGDSYFAIKRMNESLSSIALPENAESLKDFFGKFFRVGA